MPVIPTRRAAAVTGASLILHLLKRCGTEGRASVPSLAAWAEADPRYVRRVCARLEGVGLLTSVSERRPGVRPVRAYGIHPDWLPRVPSPVPGA